MNTPAEARRERARTRRELAKTERAAYKKRQADRKRKAQRAKQERRRKLALAVELCRENARAAADVAASAFKRGVQALRDRRKQTMRDAAAGCSGSKAQIRSQAERTIRSAQTAAAEERKARAELARIEAGNRKRLRAQPKASSAERRSESDDAVEVNIPAHLEPLWKRVKGKIKGSPRKPGAALLAVPALLLARVLRVRARVDRVVDLGRVLLRVLHEGLRPRRDAWRTAADRRRRCTRRTRSRSVRRTRADVATHLERASSEDDSETRELVGLLRDWAAVFDGWTRDPATRPPVHKRLGPWGEFLGVYRRSMARVVELAKARPDGGGWRKREPSGGSSGPGGSSSAG